MLTIRLQRAGKKNRPEFRVVLAESTAAVNKKFVEILGNYNPSTKVLGVRNQERLTYWIGQHISMSPTVHNLLVTNNLLDAKKVRAFNTPKKPPEAVKEEAPKAVATEAEAPAVTEDAPAEVPTEPEVVPETPSEPEKPAEPETQEAPVEEAKS